MTKSDVLEVLAALYLRLNGYFTTGLILHSPEWGQSKTNIDCLAIRHFHHSQVDRGLVTAELFNDNQEVTDLVLCEVKGNPNKLSFNRPIRTDPEALCTILRWAGIFSEAQIDSVVCRLQPLLQEGVTPETARMGVFEGGFRVRALLCCPTLGCADIGRWCLTGYEIFGYARRCFNPDERRPSSSTRYNFQQWGYPFTPIVQWFKEQPDTPSLEALYEHLGVK
jgi:hypothetical protein